VRQGASNNVAGADALLTDAAVGLFDTEDARGGIRSFLTSGPGLRRSWVADSKRWSLETWSRQPLLRTPLI
jgi:hypothetical protein